MNRKKILGYAIGPIGSGLLGFISLPIITWFYSVEDIGRISMLQIYISFCILLFCFGLDQAYVREYHENTNKGELLNSLSFPTIMITVICLIGLLLFSPSFISIHLYNIDSAYLSIITVSAFFAAVISRYLALILRMQEKALQFSMSQILPKILFLIFLVNVVVFDVARNTESLVTANALSIIAACSIYIWNTRKDLKSALKAKFNPQIFHKGCIYAFPLIFSSLAGWGLNIADRLFLKNYSSLSELGVYSVSMSIATIATLFAGIFNTIWAPMVFKWQSQNSVETQKIHIIANNVVAIVFFLVVFLGLFSWVLPYFFPQQYVNIQYLLPCCLLAPLLYTISEITGIGVSLKRKTIYTMLASVIAMLTSIALCYLLVPVYGAKGASSATVFAFFVFFLVRTLFSEIVWQKMYDFKFYSPLLILIFMGQFTLFWNGHKEYIYIGWVITLFIGIFIYKKIVSSFYNKVFLVFKRS